jgi:glycine/D-amino acid oxidase-like deaminating enzyme
MADAGGAAPPAVPDELAQPVVGESALVPGFHACVSSTGFTFSPLLARRLAEQMVAPASSSLFPDRYSLDRATLRMEKT